MKTLVFILAVAVSGIVFAEDVELVKVYCSSPDLEAGFKDRGASYFCKELGKLGEKKRSLAVTSERASADALVNYLGRQPVTRQGETAYHLGGYIWQPSQSADGIRAVVTVGEFQRGFFAEGINDVPLGSVKRQVEEWIRENRATILEKAQKQ